MTKPSPTDQQNGKRMRDARLAAGYETAAEFGRAIGVAESTMRTYETGVRRPPLEVAERIASALRIDLSDILTGRLRPNARLSPTVFPSDLLSLPNDLPVYGQGAGSILGKGAISMSGDLGYVRRPPGLAGAKTAYALYVVGQSMEPRYFQGDLLFVQPGRPPRPGDTVVIQIQDSENADIVAYIKIFQRMTDDEVICQQYNPACTIRYARATVRAVQRIMTNNDLFGA